MAELAWQEIDPSALPPVALEAYVAYKAAYKAAKQAKQTFEESVIANADLPAGKTLKFGYNFGRLSIALADDTTKPAKIQAPKQSLAAYLATMTNSGRRV